jgi:hypothetical protein
VITHPRTEELAQAVGAWIDQIRPGLDPRNAFLARVAANAMATIGRELTLGPAAAAQAVARMSELLGHAGDQADLNSELCAKIRAGELTVETPGLLAAMQVIARDQLAIDQPNYRPEGTPAP